MYISLKRILIVITMLFVLTQIFIFSWLAKYFDRYSIAVFGSDKNTWYLIPGIYLSLIILFIFTIIISYIAYQYLNEKEEKIKQEEINDKIELLKNNQTKEH